jgi:hypothetical protein
LHIACYTPGQAGALAIINLQTAYRRDRLPGAVEFPGAYSVQFDWQALCFIEAVAM